MKGTKKSKVRESFTEEPSVQKSKIVLISWCPEWMFNTAAKGPWVSPAVYGPHIEGI